MQGDHGGGHGGLVVHRDSIGVERPLHGFGDVRLVDSSRDKELAHLDGIQGEFLRDGLECHIILVEGYSSIHLVLDSSLHYTPAWLVYVLSCLF